MQRQLSSTDLLKSLLEEPIKRSWLCRSACNSSTDDQSDNNSQKSPHSSEGEQLERFLVSMPGSGNDKLKSYASNWSASGQAGLSNAALMQKTAKPDLPGRVSFSKPNMHNDVDSSDCDNDKQEIRSSISAPGPLTLPSFSYSNNATANKSESSTDAAAAAAAQKKSVHFGAPVAGSGSAEVLAETYEYPKCPSENCTCSTRSSSTASTNEATADTKCACDAPSCRYAEQTSQLQLPLPVPQKVATPELNVIREYKQAVAVPLEQLVAKAKPLEPMHNMELPNYLDKYAAQAKDKQNNLSEKNLSNSSINSSNNNTAVNSNSQGSTNSHVNSNSQLNTYTHVTSNSHVNSNSQGNTNSHVNSNTHVNSNSHVNSNRGSAQRNFGAENNFLPLMQDDRRQYSTNSSDAVINNYLKVATTTPPFVGKKKENVKPASAEANTKQQQKPLRFQSKTSAGSTAGKLKKAVSVGSLREERKLSEYNLDKVDSWMSMQEQKQALAQFEELHKQGMDEFNDSVSQLSLKSNEEEEEEDSRGSTYDEIVSVIKEIEEDKKRGVYQRGAWGVILRIQGIRHFKTNYSVCRQLCGTFAQRAKP